MAGLFSKDKGEEAKIKITGMSCQHCVGKVEKGLVEMDGVLSAEVDLDQGVATIRFDPEKTDPEALRQKVLDIGYQVA